MDEKPLYHLSPTPISQMELSCDSEKRWKKHILTGKTDARCEIDPRFELYKIIIDEITPDRTPNIITLNSSLREETLYERKDGDPPVPIGKPLRFSGPSIPPVCLDPVWIIIGDPHWYWGFDFEHAPGPGRGPLTEVVSDEEETGVKARIFYEEIKRSVEAHLQITLSTCRGDLSGYQFGGKISATTNGNSDTERLLLSSLDDHTHTPVKLGTALPLDRSVVAMPLGSMLHLHFGVLSLTGEAHKLLLNVGDCEIDVPEYPCKVSYVQKIESRDIVIKRRREVCEEVQSEREFLDEEEVTFLNDKIEDEVVTIQVTWVSDDSEFFALDPVDEVPLDDGDDDDDDDDEDKVQVKI